jgi:hypothetical protein
MITAEYRYAFSSDVRVQRRLLLPQPLSQCLDFSSEHCLSQATLAALHHPREHYLGLAIVVRSVRYEPSSYRRVVSKACIK